PFAALADAGNRARAGPRQFRSHHLERLLHAEGPARGHRQEAQRRHGRSDEYAGAQGSHARARGHAGRARAALARIPADLRRERDREVGRADQGRRHQRGLGAKEDAMTSKIFGSIIALVLACATATAADIRRVVTALDGNDKAIALFDSRITLEPGATPSANPWATDATPAPLSFTGRQRRQADGAAARPRHRPARGRISAARSGRRGETGPRLHDEDHRRTRAEAGPSRAASADAP